jgi:hypothetical protein
MIRRQSDGFWFFDLGSINGSTINGRRVTTNPTGTWMVYRAGPTAAAQTWLTATNTALESTGGVYIVQLPSLATNVTGWVYNALLYSDAGQVLAQQFGRLDITATSVTGEEIGRASCRERVSVTV